MWGDMAEQRSGNVSCPQLVSVAFVTIWWAGPVIDDQWDADQGKQHPQAQEEGSLEQHKGKGIFSEANHIHLGKK